MCIGGLRTDVRGMPVPKRSERGGGGKGRREGWREGSEIKKGGVQGREGGREGWREVKQRQK